MNPPFNAFFAAAIRSASTDSREIKMNEMSHLAYYLPDLARFKMQTSLMCRAHCALFSDGHQSFPSLHWWTRLHWRPNPSTLFHLIKLQHGPTIFQHTHTAFLLMSANK